MSRDFSVRSHRHEYQVEFVPDAVDVLRDLVVSTDHILADANVVRLYPGLAPVLGVAQIIQIDPSEAAKSYQAVGPIIAQLSAQRVTKRSRLIAIGGGTTQDVTGFVASILFRGLDWLFVPTTLLTQCDSCIGSKSSINFGEYKNQLGSFFPPKRILIADAFLDTLPHSEMLSGFGEMLHYVLVSGEEDFAVMERDLESALTDREVMATFIERSLQIKRAMIEADEFDRGPRNVFNYGHSFGHAIESATHYTVSHGIAVAFGMDLANILSADAGLITMALRNRIRKTLARVLVGTDLDRFDPGRFFDALGRDKKNEGAQRKVILTKGLGQMFKTTLPADTATTNRIVRFFADKLYEGDL